MDRYFPEPEDQETQLIQIADLPFKNIDDKKDVIDDLREIFNDIDSENEFETKQDDINVRKLIMNNIDISD